MGGNAKRNLAPGILSIDPQVKKCDGYAWPCVKGLGSGGWLNVDQR